MAKKKAKGFGMSWEDEYGYAQAVKVGKTIYVSDVASTILVTPHLAFPSQLIEIKFVARV